MADNLGTPRAVSDQDHPIALPATPHTIFIIVGALGILWLLGAVTFKGIRQ